MENRISARLAAIVDALPLRPCTRVLEIGCGPGAMAREIARRIGDGHVLAIDRSAKAVQQARAASAAEIAAGRMSVRQAAIEDFELEPGEAPFDIAVAIRVGALDGRHPELQGRAHRNIARALAPHGRLFIDGGDPLREIALQPFPPRDSGDPGLTYEDLVNALRAVEGLVDVGQDPPNFHYRSRPFLHFHVDEQGAYADVRFGSGGFEPVRASTPRERQELLARVCDHIERIERSRKSNRRRSRRGDDP